MHISTFIGVETLSDDCPACDGRGRECSDGVNVDACRDCRGTGGRVCDVCGENIELGKAREVEGSVVCAGDCVGHAVEGAIIDERNAQQRASVIGAAEKSLKLAQSVEVAQ
jgi:hypothetical protein